MAEAGTVGAEEAASTVVGVASAVVDTSAAEVRARAMAAEARVLLLPEDIVEERRRVLMVLMDRGDQAEPTERGDLARTAAGRMVALPTVRDTLALMAAGLPRHQQVHVTVQLLTVAQTQRQPHEITARLALTLIVARLPGTPRRPATAETPRCRLHALLAERLVPIGQGQR